MPRLTLDDSGSFDVTRLDAASPKLTALFSVGGGGNPERHGRLLQSLAERGCTDIAPLFERLAAPAPTATELFGRARRLALAMTFLASPDMPIVGIGHSIGATLLLVLAGGSAWTLDGKRVALASNMTFDKLALMTPATDFFRAPGALEGVNTPIRAWAGSQDTITPPRHAEFLKQAVQSRADVEITLIEGANHFSFMNELPPNVVDPLPDRSAFLTTLEDEICRFVLTP